MDALLAAAVTTAPGITVAARGTVRIVLLPTAVARHRPELAVAHGERAFRAAAARAGVDVRVDTAWVLARDDAADPAATSLLADADLVHLPGGDPDLIPTVLRGTPAWTAILRAVERGACLAGASAGAMALGGRLWTRDGPMDGLGLVPGVAVLPHFSAGRLAEWRSAVEVGERGGRPLTWLGLDEQTLVIGRPGDATHGGEWRVAGAGRARVFRPGPGTPGVSAGAGETIIFG